MNFSTIMPTPSVQASSLICTEVSDSQLRLSWTRGNGRFVIIVGRLTVSSNIEPLDNTTITGNSVFSSGTDLGAGNYVVYDGSASSVVITGLTASTAYTFISYEFNKTANGTERYLTTISSVAQTTLPPQIAPTIQSTSLVYTGDRRLNLTRGNGGFVLVVAKSGGAVDSNPVDNTTYTAAAFGLGTQIGTGNYVVYNGTAAALDIDGLPYGVSYGVQAFEYNLASGNPKYYTSTATGNPITAVAPSIQTWYSYKDTPFLTRRSPYNLSTVSREFSQLYPIGDYLGSTYHYVWFITEGDGTRLTGIDRSIRYKRAIASDPTVKSNWVADSPVDAYGDTPSFLDQGSGWRAYQNWGLMSVVDSGAGTLYGYYVANAGSAARYSVGLMTSTDDGATWADYGSNPLISQGATFSCFYVKVLKDETDWWMFVENYVLSQLVEGHLLCLEIWHSTDGLSWSKQTSVDQLSGRNYGGAVDISQPWKEGGTYYAYISPNAYGIDGGYQSKAEGATAFKSTYPVGNKILLISWTDWTNFKSGHIVEREIYRNSQQTEIESRTWCQKRTFSGNDFFVSMGFLWKGQTLLNGTQQMEPMNDGKIVSRSLNTTNATQVGSEIYPNYVKLAKPHQSFVNDVLGTTPSPKNVIANTNGTVVGSPRVARMNSIQAVGNGFVTFPNAEFVYDANYLSVKVIVGQNALTTAYGICGMDTDVVGGQHGWHIRKSSQYNFEVWIYSSNNAHYKRYRAQITGNLANNDATLFNVLGFEFKNGILKLRVDYNLDVIVTKVVDDSFTTMNVSNEVLRIGAIYPTTNDEMYSQDVVGGMLMWSGVTNVTDSNYLNTNLIGY